MIAMLASSWWRAVAVGVVCAAVGAAAAYRWEHRARVAETARLRAQMTEMQARADIERAEAAARAEVAARAAAERAARAADAALAQRDARIAALSAETRRLRRDIHKKTTGRDCLDAAAVRVLGTAPGILPQGAPDAAGAHAAAATDTDIAEWILDAAELYEQCRARIDAIRQWDEVIHGR
jgi:hypothetical protein